MTNLESPRKNNDCYFYYYSTCKKGDNCTFRHEPSALGCETTCSFWKEGKCINVHCNFRHMELRKNRKSIPCYWETQPSGCKKPHCPFMHVSKKEGDLQNNDANANVESDDASSTVSKKDDFSAPVVDPIVVKFEEAESDNESSTTTHAYHLKTRNQSHDHLLQVPQADQLDYEHQPDSEPSTRVIKVGTKQQLAVKTLEEIKLDRIQAESAAYYSYSDGSSDPEAVGRGKSVFKRLQPLEASEKQKAVNIESIKVLTLDEIRKRKRRQPEKEDPEQFENDNRQDNKKQKIQINSAVDDTRPKKIVIEKPRKDISEIKIKTLAELKAERLQKRKLQEFSDDQSICEQPSKRGRPADASCENNESEVSSTSKSEENASISSCNSHMVYDSATKVQCVVAPVKRTAEKETEHKCDDVCSNKNEEISGNSSINELLQRPAGVDTISEANESKLDELLLEDDDDDDDTCTTPVGEDDILKEIDSFLND